MPATCAAGPVVRAIMTWCADQINLSALLHGQGSQAATLRKMLAGERRKLAEVDGRMARLTEIMLIVGVSTYVGVMEKMGTIDFVGHSVAGLTSPLMAALLLCFVGAVVSAFASSTAVLGSLIPLAVPFLQGEHGVSAIGFIAANQVRAGSLPP